MSNESIYTRAIVLQRKDFRENDILLNVYTDEFGLLDLVARGAKKIQSKLSGHLEPFFLTEIMIVHGKNFNYIGSAVGQNAFAGIKSDLEKINIAGKAVNLFSQLITGNEADKKIFQNIYFFLDFLDKSDLAGSAMERYLYFFIFKTICLLGYSPNFYTCASCGADIGNNFSELFLEKNMLFCPNCRSVSGIKTNIATIDILNNINQFSFPEIYNKEFGKKANINTKNTIIHFYNFFVD